MYCIAGINAFDQTPPEEWFQMNAVLRVSLGNFLFFAIFSLVMIGVKDQNDRRDAWHHGGWIAKIAVWAVLIVLMFCVPNIVITIYGKSVTSFLIIHIMLSLVQICVCIS
jgi:serine incorporator 1/3